MANSWANVAACSLEGGAGAGPGPGRSAVRTPCARGFGRVAGSASSRLSESAAPDLVSDPMCGGGAVKQRDHAAAAVVRSQRF
jgi:hypothetical protein